MRRAIVTTALLAALISGCGGSAGQSARTPVTGSGSGAQGQGATVTASASDGRLGGALVARPGKTTLRGHVEKISGKLAKPHSNLHGVGAEDNCSDQDVQPTQDNLAHVGDVVFCLMNAMRTDAGVPALRLQGELTQASVGHSQDMVDNKYFAHDSQDGRDVVARLKQVGYIPATGDWVIGENLAWGSGALATPKALVNAWMNSPEHRDNLLSGDFQEVGMGVVYGTPSADAPDGVTVTTDFGTRPGSASSTTSGSNSGSTTASTSGTSGSDLGTAVNGTATGAVAGAKARLAKARAARARAARRRRALRRCRHRHGHRRRRCVHAARHLR